MKIRHRTPSIFSLSMVDMLCCALGCVIFLWILNFWQARDRTAKAGQVQQQLEAARDRLSLTEKDADALRQLSQANAREKDRIDYDLAAARGRLEQSSRDITELKSLLEAAGNRLTLTEKEREAYRLQSMTAAKDRDRLNLDLAAARKDITALKAAIASTEDRLTKRGTEQDALVKDLANLKLLLRASEVELARRMKELENTERQILTLQMLSKEKDLVAKAAARSADDVAGQLRDSEARIAALTKSLADQRVQSEKSNQLRLAAENRFAGIVMSGRRVVFLVDTSGSMELIDGVTPAPEKWTGVCESLRRVMQSLPDLEKFQVITFATDVSHPLGSEGRWLDYDPKKSADDAFRTVRAIRPKGNTHMYAAFEAAFRLRAEGLDTIYILSDGLPNIGPGLPADGGKNLNDTDRAALLSQHVLRTLRLTWNRATAGRPRVRINAIGFFYESPDVGAFLWALARENDGSFVGMSKP